MDPRESMIIQHNSKFESFSGYENLEDDENEDDEKLAILVSDKYSEFSDDKIRDEIKKLKNMFDIDRER